MNITYVKKITTDGTACKKCAEVTERLEKADQMRFIDRVVIADERDPESEGMLIASQYNVERAPFFVVTQDDGETKVYTVYFKFVKDVLNQETNDKQALKDILDQRDDLDFI